MNRLNPILIDILVFLIVPMIATIGAAVIFSALLDKQALEIKQLKHDNREMAYEIQSLRLRLAGQLNVDL